MATISQFDNANYCSILDVELMADLLRVNVEVVGEAKRPTDALITTRSPSKSFSCRKSKVTQQYGGGLKASLFFDKMIFTRGHHDVIFEYNPGYSRVSIKHMCDVPQEDWSPFFEQVNAQNEGMMRVLDRRVQELTTLRNRVQKDGWTYDAFEFLEQADVLIVAGALRFVPIDTDPEGLDLLLRRCTQLLESRHEAVALTTAEQLLRLVEYDGGYNNDAWRLIHGVTKRSSTSVRQTSMTGPLSRKCKELCRVTERYK